MLNFKFRHAPINGLHFWIALCIASVLGCNTGDYFAKFFGHLNGLPLLAVAFLSVLLLEQRDAGSSKAWYWIAIILVRTAATNLADWCAHGIGIVPALGVLAALLAAVIVSVKLRRDAQGIVREFPTVDGMYWLTMLIAGTLGTALGDFSSFKTGLGLGGASIVLSLLVAVLVAIKSAKPPVLPLSYWLVVVTIRTAGTSVGDFFAHTFGLWQSTVYFALLFAAFFGATARSNPPPQSTRVDG